MREVFQALLGDGVMSLTSSLLAVCSGREEAEVFLALGLRNVTLCGLDDSWVEKDLALPWHRQDVRRLTFADGSFDFTFVSDGLHHCDTPHGALLEMYRVARLGVIVFESRDGLLMRLATALRMAAEYEVAAVEANAGVRGGVNDTEVPNFVYRWTEREFIKTISAHNPLGRHCFRFFYGLNLPYQRFSTPAAALFLRAAEPVLRVATALLRRQRNSFAMVAIKPRIPGDLYPWLHVEGGKISYRGHRQG